MDTTKTKSFFYRLRGICSRCYPWSTPFSLTLPGNTGLLLLLITVLLFSGCKTVPILDRNFAGTGGLWEQDENAGARFHHNAIADNAVIGSLYSSGKSALINGSQGREHTQIKNNSFVSTGMQSSARIEFKASDAASCLIRVDEFNIGNAYVDTSYCQQSIRTLHAMIEAKSAILHIHVSQHQTEVMVISGAIEIILRENPTQSTTVEADQTIIITHNAIGRPRSVTTDEIWQRIRWRDDFHLYETVIDWRKVVAGVVTVAIIAAVILLSKGHSGRGHSGRGHGSGFPRHR